MDRNSKMIYSCPRVYPLPFYMSHPGYWGREHEQEVWRDLEYFQQIYPNQIKRYQRKVADILDKMDYEGSMIYDEYPDKYTLQRLAGTVVEILKRENRELPPEEQISEEKWEALGEIMIVLLCDEIYKRRHGGPRGFLKF